MLRAYVGLNGRPSLMGGGGFGDFRVSRVEGIAERPSLALLV